MCALTRWVRQAVSGLLLTCLALYSIGLQANDETVKLIGTRVVDMQGQIIQLGLADGVVQPTVFTFLDTQCVTSDKEVKRLQRMQQLAVNNGQSFYAVVVDPGANWAGVKDFVESKGLLFPVIFDADANLANQAKPSKHLESVLVSKTSELLYRGNSKGGLKKAIKALAKGKGDRIKHSKAKGCDLAWAQAGSAAEVSYNREVAPIIYANCAECHRQNGIAPFPLVDYQQAKNFSYMIAHVTKQGIMPPWKVRDSSAHFINERVLSDHQVALLDQWSKAGAPQGKPADQTPLPTLHTGDWILGEPDIVITMPEAFDVPAGGPDIYRYFVAENAIPDDMEIIATDFLPGDPSVVHHCNFFVDYSGRALKKDQETAEPGFSIFGTGGFFSYTEEDRSFIGMSAWAPGSLPTKFSNGVGRKLRANGDFVFEVHYHPSGKKGRDQSKFGIYLAKKPVTKPIIGLFAGTSQMDIPPGEKDFQRHFWMNVPADMSIVSIGPHMHYLGTRAKTVVTYPDGKKDILFDVDWDFRWQGAYLYSEPLKIPKGSRIDTWVVYDNSSDNPYNPYNPPVKMGWGWETDEEMGELYLNVIVDSDKAARKLQKAATASWYRGSIVKDKDKLAQRN